MNLFVPSRTKDRAAFLGGWLMLSGVTWGHFPNEPYWKLLLAGFTFTFIAWVVSGGIAIAIKWCKRGETV